MHSSLIPRTLASLGAAGAFAILAAGSAGDSGPKLEGRLEGDVPSSVAPGDSFEVQFVVKNTREEPLTVDHLSVDEDAGLRALFTLTDPPQLAYEDKGTFGWQSRFDPVQIAPGQEHTFTYTVEPAVPGPLDIEITAPLGEWSNPKGEASTTLEGEVRPLLELQHDMPESMPLDGGFMTLTVHNHSLRTERIKKIRFSKAFSKKVWMWPEFPYDESDLETREKKATVLKLDEELPAGKSTSFEWEVDPQKKGTFSGTVGINTGGFTLAAETDLRVTVQ